MATSGNEAEPLRALPGWNTEPDAKAAHEFSRPHISKIDASDCTIASDSVRCLAAGCQAADLEEVSGSRGADESCNGSGMMKKIDRRGLIMQILRSQGMQ